MSTNIQVCIKIRPPISREVAENCKSLWYVKDTNIVQRDENGRLAADIFSFDHIFNECQTNSEVYDSVVSHLVQSSIEGFNSTVFAYGQTSSGKTYTMLGDRSSKTRGIMHLAIDDLFDHINKDPNRKYLTRCSYIEIYNEKINDLLDKNGKDLRIREDVKGIKLNIKEEMVNESAEVFHLMKLGNKIRKIGCTDMNERSSRSHTIFKIIIQSTENGSEGSYKESHLNFVDLAGSERVGHMQLTGERHLEGVHINKSLTTLGMVIRKLSENEAFINYRDSKLTRLLQSALGGNSKTLVIAAVTLAASDETKSTLEFARRAKAVQNKPTINQMVTDTDQMTQYKKMLKNYEDNLKALEVDRENKTKTIEQLQNKVKHISIFMPSAFQTRGSQLACPTPMRRHTLAFGLPRGPIPSAVELPVLSEDEEFSETTDSTAPDRDFVMGSRCSVYSNFSEEEESNDFQSDKETQTSFTEVAENDQNWNFLDNICDGNTTLQPGNTPRRTSGNQSSDTLWNKTFSDIEERDNTFEFKELREHNFNLQNQLIQLMAELKDFKTEKEKDFEEMNLLVREARKDKQLSCAKYEEEILELKQSLEKIKGENRSLGFTLEQALTEKNNVATKLKNLQNDSDFLLNNTTQNFNKKIKRLTEEIDKLHNSTNVSLYQTRDDESNSEKTSKLQTDLQKTNEICQNYQKEIEVLQQKCGELTKGMKRLEQENSKLKNVDQSTNVVENIEQLKQQYDEILEKLSREAEQNAMLIEKCDKLKDEKEKLNIENKILSEEKIITNQKCVNLTDEVNRLKKETDILSSKLESTVKSVSEVEMLRNTLIEKEKEIAKLVEDIDGTEEKYKICQFNLEIDCKKYKEDIDQLNHQNEEIREKLSIELEQNAMLIEKCDKLKGEKERLNIENKIISEENIITNQKCVNLIDEVNRLKKETDILSSKLESTVESISEVEILRNTLFQREKEISKLIKDIDDTEEKHKKCQLKLEIDCKKYKEDIDQLNHQNEEIREKLNIEFEQNAKLIVKYDSLKDEKEKLNVEYKIMSEENKILHQKYENLAEELKIVKEEKDIMNSKLESAVQSITEVEILKSTVTEKESEIVKFMRDIEEYRDLQLKLENDCKKYKKSIHQLGLQNDENQGKLKTESEDNVMLMKKCENLKDEKEKLNKELTILSKENKALHEKCEDLTQEVKRSKEWKNDKEQLKNTLLEKENHISKLLQDIKTIELDYNNLQCELQKVTAENKERFVQLKQQSSEYQERLEIETEEKRMIICEFEKLKIEKESLNSKCESLCDENNILSFKLKDLTQERTNIILQCEIIKDNLDDVTNKYELLKNENQKLNIQSENLTKEKEGLANRFANLLKEYEVLLLKYDNLNPDKENLNFDLKGAAANKVLSKGRTLTERNVAQEKLEPLLDKQEVSTPVSMSKKDNEGLKLFNENRELIEENRRIAANLEAAYKDLTQYELEIKTLEAEKDALIEEYDQKMFDQIDKYEELRTSMLKEEKEVMKLLLTIQDILINDLPTADKKFAKEDKIIRSIRRLSYSVEVCKMLESEKDMIKLETELLNINRENAELSELYRVAKNEAEGARKEVQEARQELKGLKEENEVNKYKSNTQLEDKILALESQLDSAKQENEELNEKILELSGYLDAANREIKNLTRNIVNLEGVISNSNKHREELKKLLELNEKELQELRLVNETNKNQSNKLLEDKILELESQLHSTKLEKQEINERTLEMSCQLNATNKEIENLTRKIVDLECFISNSNKEKDEFKNLLDLNDKALKKLKCSRDNALATIKDLEENISEVKLALLATTAENENLKQKYVELTTEYQSLTEKYDVITTKIEKLKEKCVAISTEYENLKKKYHTLTDEYDLSIKTNVQLKQRISELNDQLVCFTAENKELKMMYEMYKDQINKEEEKTKAEEISLLKEDIEERNKKIARKDVELLNLKSDVQKLVTENNDLSNKIQQLRRENEKKLTEIKNVLCDRDALNEKLQNKIFEIEKEHSSKINKMVADEKKLEARLAQEMEKASKSTRTSLSSKDNDSLEISRLRTEIHRLKTENKELNDQCNEFFEHIQKQDEVYSEPAAKIEYLESQLKQLKDKSEKLANLEKREKELQAEKERMQKILKERDMEIVKLTTRGFDIKRHYTAKIEKYEEELKRLSGTSSKLGFQKVEVKECGIQVDTMDYNRLLDKYQQVKYCAQRRKAENLELRKRLNLGPDANVLND